MIEPSLIFNFFLSFGCFCDDFGSSLYLFAVDPFLTGIGILTKTLKTIALRCFSVAAVSPRQEPARVKLAGLLLLNSLTFEFGVKP